MRLLRWLVLAVFLPVTALGQIGPGGGGTTGNVSAATVTATGTTTPQTTADRAAYSLNTKDFGVKCDGSTDDTSNLNQALTYAASVHVALYLQANTAGCFITAPLTPPSFSQFVGIDMAGLIVGNPAQATAISLNGTTGVILKDLTIQGNVATPGGTGALTFTQNPTTPIINMNGTTFALVDNLRIMNPAKDIRLDGASFNAVTRINMTNGQYVGSQVNNSNFNLLEDFQANLQNTFTVFVTGTSHDNRFVRVSSYDTGRELVGISPPANNNTITDPKTTLPPVPYLPWTTAMSVTAGQRVVSNNSIFSAGSTGTTGASPPTCGSGTCSDGTITWTWQHGYGSSGDNCISMTGNRNSVVGGILSYCYRDGVAMYGSDNSATGAHIFDNGQGVAVHYAGVEMTSNFGGIAKNNVATGNIVDDDQAAPTQYYPFRVSGNTGLGGGYPNWVTATVYAALAYVIQGQNLYQTLAGGTSGATAPTCTSLTCSDGAVTWTFVQTFVGNTQSTNNTIAGNMVGAFAGPTELSIPTTSGQYQKIFQDSLRENTSITENSTGFLVSGNGSMSFQPVSRVWASATAASFGQVYSSTNGRSYRVIIEGTTAAGDAPTCGTANCTQTTADGVGWILVESLINFPSATLGTHQFTMNGCGALLSATDNVTTVLDCAGTGTPQGAVTAAVGSTYHRTDGGASTTFYVKESGTGNTGWVAK
jgi:hypothetical protein